LEIVLRISTSETGHEFAGPFDRLSSRLGASPFIPPDPNLGRDDRLQFQID
jgi:hypothetical protein